MESVKAFFGMVFGSAIGAGFFLAGTLGWAYWMWMAVSVGSFGMFFFGLLGPLTVVAGILGLWSFISECHCGWRISFGSVMDRNSSLGGFG